MGLFDKESNSNTTVDETNVNNVDNRAVQADEANIGGNVSLNFGDIDIDNRRGYGADISPVGDISVTTTDFGALDTASEITDRSFDFSSDVVNTLSSTVNETVDAVQEIAQSATQDEAARTQQFLILGGVLVSITVLFIYSRRSKK